MGSSGEMAIRMRKALLASAIVALAACSEIGSSGHRADDPQASYQAASLEVPVNIVAGLYEIRLGGATVVELKSASRTDRICLNSYDASQFPNDPLFWTVERWDACSNELDSPKGNAMSGARICEKRKMPRIARYTGTHSADSFRIDGVVKQSDDENESVMHLGSGTFSIIGKRVGDCSY